MNPLCGIPVLLLLVCSSRLSAQTTVSIGAHPACSSCAVDLRPQLVLGGPDDPAGFAPLVQIARSVSGEFAVSSTTFTGELFIYGSNGRLKKVIGRRGSGPGEFTRMQFLAYGARDSLHTIDASGPRYSVFSPDHVFVRSAELGVRAFAFQLQPSGNLYLVAPKQEPDGGRALQAFTPAGTFVHAFDPIDSQATGQAAFGRQIAVDARIAVERRLCQVCDQGMGTEWSALAPDHCNS